MNRKRLAMVTTSFPTAFDGQEAAGLFVYDIAEALSRLADVTVVAPARAIPSGDRPGQPFDVEYFTVKSLPLSLLNPLNPRDWWNIFYALGQGRKCVHRLTTLKRFDHILCLWALPPGYWGYSACKRFGTPYSVWVLGSDIWVGAAVPLVRSLLKKILRLSTGCMADGPSLVNAAERLSGRPYSFVPSGRRLFTGNQPPLRKDPPYRLAFLGRWHANKGTDLLCESLDLLSKSDWGSIECIRVAGGGPLDSFVHERLGRLIKADYPVLIEGFKDREGAAELLKWADYVLVPSRRDSIPVIFSDAMQCNSPVVVNPVGDLPFVVENFGVGIISEGVSSRAFAEVIRRALRTPPLSFEKGIKKAAEFFDIDRIARQVLSCLGMEPPL